MAKNCILWRRVDVEGHDACRLDRDHDGWTLSGSAAYDEDGAVVALNYSVVHDRDWTTRSARISGWAAEQTLDIEIIRRPDGLWSCNGSSIETVKNCIDIDLGFTPATNTTAIRRLELETGQSMKTCAAWLDPSDWKLKPLDQQYTRETKSTFQYCSLASGFTTQLTVNDLGLVEDYPGIWTRAE